MSCSRSPGTGPFARTHLWLSLAEVYLGWLVHMWVLQNSATATASWLLLNHVASPVTALPQYCSCGTIQSLSYSWRKRMRTHSGCTQVAVAGSTCADHAGLPTSSTAPQPQDPTVHRPGCPVLAPSSVHLCHWLHGTFLIPPLQGLARHGIRSVVFDTGEHSVGGRLGTRSRRDGSLHPDWLPADLAGVDLAFDHAAQCFTATDPRCAKRATERMAQKTPAAAPAPAAAGGAVEAIHICIVAARAAGGRVAAACG